MRHEIYANLHQRAVVNRILSQQAEGGDENGISGTNSIEEQKMASPSDNQVKIPVTLHTKTVRYNACENNKPAVYYDLENEQSDMTSYAQANPPSMRSTSPSNWDGDLDIEYLPELQDIRAGSHEIHSSVTALEYDFGVALNETSSDASNLANGTNEHVTPEMISIPPPSQFADEDIEKDGAGPIATTTTPQSISTSGQQLLNNASENLPSNQGEVNESTSRDVILQLIAERVAFQRQSNHEIADRVCVRSESRGQFDLSYAELSRILFAIDVYEKLFIDRINDIISIALSAESSGQLAIAMLIQELRSRSTSRPN